MEEREFLADPLDQAAVLTQSLSDDGVKLASRLSEPEQVKVQNEDGEWVWPITECIDCGDELGARLELGKIRCLRCQTIREKRRSGYFTVQQ